MQRYSKLIAGVVGNLVGVALVALAFYFPGVADCAAVVDPDLPDACTIFGFDQITITAAVMVVVNALFIERSPANA